MTHKVVFTTAIRRDEIDVGIVQLERAFSRLLKIGVPSDLPSRLYDIFSKVKPDFVHIKIAVCGANIRIAINPCFAGGCNSGSKEENEKREVRWEYTNSG